MERTALQKSFEAWVPPQWSALEDWIPTPPAPRSRRPEPADR